MSSKACGEPSLLLSTSVLHAMRMAVHAARSELAALTGGALRKPPSGLASTGALPGEASQQPPSRFGLLLNALNGVTLGAPLPAASSAADAAAKARSTALLLLPLFSLFKLEKCRCPHLITGVI
jgi:hypothetical protein